MVKGWRGKIVDTQGSRFILDCVDPETPLIDIDKHNSEPDNNLLARKTKSERVTDQLREYIVAGMKPEARLASYQELETTFGVSRAVIREAVNQLKREGFIYSIDRKGLYVSGRPPYLSRFAMVFATNPSAPDWPRFFTALQQEATGVARERGDISFTSYYDVAAGPGTDSYDRLFEDVQYHRLAGMLLLPPCHELGHTEPFGSLAMPRLYICGDTLSGNVPSVTTDQKHMSGKMAQWLRERGRKRVAVVGLSESGQQTRTRLLEYGIPFRPHWLQTIGRDNFADVRNVVTLLMDYPAEQRPDGLVIYDDNLTEHAVGGLLQAGVQIGRDVDVIAHCNWPWPVASPVPIKRVGFHARDVVSLSVRAIEKMRKGEPLAQEQIKVPALFEEEINKASAARLDW